MRSGISTRNTGIRVWLRRRSRRPRRSERLRSVWRRSGATSTRGVPGSSFRRSGRCQSGSRSLGRTLGVDRRVVLADRIHRFGKRTNWWTASEQTRQSTRPATTIERRILLPRLTIRSERVSTPSVLSTNASQSSFCPSETTRCMPSPVILEQRSSNQYHTSMHRICTFYDWTEKYI